MSIPATMENLHIAHPSLNQTPGVQTTRRKASRLPGLLSVELEGLVGLTR